MSTNTNPAIVSDPFRRGPILNYPKADATDEQAPVYTIFQTKTPVLFSPLTDGIFEKVIKCTSNLVIFVFFNFLHDVTYPHISCLHDKKNNRDTRDGAQDIWSCTAIEPYRPFMFEITRSRRFTIYLS
jgi:hypothetical protein